VLHGCIGVSSQYRGWAELLAGWGYAALVVDSFRPRGELVDRSGHTLDIKIYPGAPHGFASPPAPHIFAGHLTGRDLAAAEDAIAATHAFSGARL
jgi:dienelactone hydrolase